MDSLRAILRIFRFAAIVGSALLSGGCSEELHPVDMPVTRVRGVVTTGGRPVSGGWIEFIPADGAIGNLRSARIGPDGTFDADRVAVGTNAIRVVDAAIEPTSQIVPLARVGWAVPVREEGAPKSKPPRAVLMIPMGMPIRRVVGAGQSAPLTIDVVAEAIKFQEERTRAMAGARTPTGESP